MRPALPLLAMNKVRALSAINSCYASRPASFALSERSAQSIPATLLAPRPSRSESAQRDSYYAPRLASFALRERSARFLLRSSPRVLRAQRALSAIPTTLLASRPSRSESAQRDSYYAPRLASFALRERSGHGFRRFKLKNAVPLSEQARTQYGVFQLRVAQC
ncbi:Uncharacterised protein [Fusobacterium naviforme]|nr:Uncharacterised protein [Fusobacterium naviforme]